jgi:two-component system, NarL family, invasion response regulator UvrY
MKLLLVDDHSIVRAGLKRLLATLPGAELREATNGHDALSLFRSERPDVVVLDINLPDISGLEVLRRLVAEDPNVRVLVLSMHSEGFHARQCLQAGATGYISKSAQPGEIIDAVRQVVAGKRYVERQIAQELALLSIESAQVEGIATPELSAREKELLRRVQDLRADSPRDQDQCFVLRRSLVRAQERNAVDLILAYCRDHRLGARASFARGVRNRPDCGPV